MMTTSNGNIFRVTGPLCGEFTGQRWIPHTKPVTRSFDVYFDLCLNRRLSKHSWGWWFETPSRPLWSNEGAMWRFSRDETELTLGYTLGNTAIWMLFIYISRYNLGRTYLVPHGVPPTPMDIFGYLFVSQVSFPADLSFDIFSNFADFRQSEMPKAPTKYYKILSAYTKRPYTQSNNSEPRNYRGPSRNRTYYLQTEATSPASSSHATENVPKTHLQAALDNWQPVSNEQLLISTHMY